MSNKYTRQGVKCLDHLPAKSKGKVLELPPNDVSNCPHTMVQDDGDGNTVCRCGKSWDFDGKPIE